MNNLIKQTQNAFLENPRKIFLIDSIGAFISSIFLLFMFYSSCIEFNFPKTTLIFLSLLAAFLCIYSTICYSFAKKRWALLLKIISISNFFYAAFTLSLLFLYHNQLTVFNLSYFITEIIIITLLSFTELYIANRTSNPKEQ
jgi:hypothetical protein